jgi:1-acyl-sn-glycerol-3-phosphate acyltransferase
VAIFTPRKFRNFPIHPAFGGTKSKLSPIFTEKFLLYRILKILAKPALFIFCRKIIIQKPELLKEQGPLLLASNHPNSFLDAVILDLLFEQPIWSLARGDVFKKRFIARILHSLKILPVYRTSEGVENLSGNYHTFDRCIDIFKENGVVLIFSEGKCINEWHLRKLKKGTARLAIKCWEQDIPLKVLPVGINYSSFRRFGKNVHLNFGNILTSAAINPGDPDGLRHQAFNQRLNEELQQLVFEIPKTDQQLQKQKLQVRVSLIKKIALALFAIPGFFLHLPLYLPIQNFTWKKTNHNDHFDSVIVALLVFTYPLYLLLITLAIFFVTKSWLSLLLFLLLPFCAWAYVQLKAQLDK